MGMAGVQCGQMGPRAASAAKVLLAGPYGTCRCAGATLVMTTAAIGSYSPSRRTVARGVCGARIADMVRTMWGVGVRFAAEAAPTPAVDGAARVQRRERMRCGGRSCGCVGGGCICAVAPGRGRGARNSGVRGEENGSGAGWSGSGGGHGAVDGCLSGRLAAFSGGAAAFPGMHGGRRASGGGFFGNGAGCSAGVGTPGVGPAVSNGLQGGGGGGAGGFSTGNAGCSGGAAPFGSGGGRWRGGLAKALTPGTVCVGCAGVRGDVVAAEAAPTGVGGGAGFL